MRLSLQKFLIQNNITVKEASEMTGVSKTVIQRVCRGTIRVSKKTREAFKNIYDLDIIEISHNVLINNETKKEEKEMKEQIKMLKNEHKENVKELKIAYENEASELKKQIKILERQAEIKELKSGLAQILSSDDDFFTRPDVLKFVKKLISLLKEKEDIEEETFEVKCEKDVAKNNGKTDEFLNVQKSEKSVVDVPLDSDCDELDDSKVYDPISYTGDDDAFFDDVEDKTKALINQDAFASDDDIYDDYDYEEDEDNDDDENDNEEFLDDNDCLKCFEESD